MNDYKECFVYVYALTDLNGNVFYVGCAENLERRFLNHLCEARLNYMFCNRKKIEKIRSLNYEILIKELDRVWVGGRKALTRVNKARAAEYEQMAKFHRMGFRLTNGRELEKALSVPKTN